MALVNWLQEVEQRKEIILEETQAFLRIPSVLDETTKTTQQPFGTDIHKALTHLLEKGAEHQFVTKNVNGYAGFIEYGQGEESVGILVHIDVVPPGEGWTTPPFSAFIRNGRIYARGAIDNKGPAMAAFFALLLVKELAGPLKRRIRLIIGTDEESDWRCMEHYFQQEEMPTVGFVPDADFPIIHAEKGIADVVFRWQQKEEARKNELTLLRFYAGERFNMVPDVAVAEVEGDHTQLVKMEEAFGGRGSATWNEKNLVLTCEGKAAHGSTPKKGENAGIMLASFLQGYSLQQEASSYLTFIKTYLDNDMDGKALEIACKDDVSGPLTVNAGIFRFDRYEASIGLNIRYPVTREGIHCFQSLQTVADRTRATLTVKDHMKPSYVEKNHPLVQTLQKVYRRQTGEEATLLTTGGGTYARSLETGVAFGALFPGREDVAHQKDEYIDIDDLLKATAIYAKAMYELAK